MRNIFNNAVGISKEICRIKIEKGDTVVDATMGNGNDTAFLCDLVGEEGGVYAFDIQEDAVLITKERLSKLKLENRAQLIHDGHENIDKYVKEKVKLIIYNLGYLPKGDHKITTKGETTIESINRVLKLLDKNGIILLVIYSGHKSGKQEKSELEAFTQTLDQKDLNVLNMRFANQKNDPPEIICIEKR